MEADDTVGVVDQQQQQVLTEKESAFDTFRSNIRRMLRPMKCAFYYGCPCVYCSDTYGGATFWRVINETAKFYYKHGVSLFLQEYISMTRHESMRDQLALDVVSKYVAALYQSDREKIALIF